jgi:hypothetical protein
MLERRTRHDRPDFRTIPTARGLIGSWFVVRGAWCVVRGEW